MSRILFVDDEKMILGSLRLHFQREQPDWDCSFVDNGFDALDAMAAEPFDVVVTDMRMPGMDGATLLGIVRERHPQTFRMVLSAQTSQEAQLRALPVMHRFHHKTGVMKELTDSIVQALELRQQFQAPAIGRVIGGLQRLPTAPDVYSDISRMMADENVGLNRIAETIQRDPATTLRLLHVANSAFFGVGRQIHSTLEALNWLGVDLTRRLVLSSELASVFGGRGGASRRFVEEVQTHAHLTARIASRLLPPERSTPTRGRLKEKRSSSLATAGLLHEVGRLVIANLVPEAHQRVMNADRGGAALCDAEEAELGFNHAQAGAYLLNLWGLPLDIVDAVAHHHKPPRGVSGQLTNAGAIYVSSALARAAMRRAPYAPHPRRLDLDPTWLREAGVDVKLPEWCVLASHQQTQMEETKPAPR